MGLSGLLSFFFSAANRASSFSPSSFPILGRNSSMMSCAVFLSIRVLGVAPVAIPCSSRNGLRDPNPILSSFCTSESFISILISPLSSIYNLLVDLAYWCFLPFVSYASGLSEERDSLSSESASSSVSTSSVASEAVKPMRSSSSGSNSEDRTSNT